MDASLTDSLISTVIGLLSTALAVAIVLIAYSLARRFLHPGHETDRSFELAGNVGVRIAALHGLILALVYAQELDDYKALRAVLVQEAVAVSDVWHDAERYGGALKPGVQQGMTAYLREVVTNEWPRLAEREGLSGAAWTTWDDIYAQILDADPETPRQEYLRGRMLDRVTEIASYRQQREAVAQRTFAVLFWVPALVGLALLAVPFYLSRPSKTHLILMSLFGAYSGMVLFFIYAFSNPFQAPGRLEPVPFQRLLDGDIGRASPTAHEEASRSG